MRKRYIRPTATDMTITPTDTLLLGASQGYTTGDNFSRRHHEDWDEEWSEDWDEEWSEDCDDSYSERHN